MKAASILCSLVMVSGLTVTGAACNGARRTPQATASLAPWSPPTAPIVRLVDLEGEISGESMLADSGVIARWYGSDFLEVPSGERASTAKRIFTLSTLPEESSRLRSALITVRPGGATEVMIEPLVNRGETGDNQTAIEKLFRTILVSIPEGADPERALTFSFPLREAAMGNWHDAAAPCRLTGLRVTVSGNRTADARIEEVVFRSGLETVSGPPAAVAPVEIGGIVRPAWSVAAGAAVAFVIDVPVGDTVLRWFDGALGNPGPRTITVVNGGFRTEVHEEQKAGAWA